MERAIKSVITVNDDCSMMSAVGTLRGRDERLSLPREYSKLGAPRCFETAA